MIADDVLLEPRKTVVDAVEAVVDAVEAVIHAVEAVIHAAEAIADLRETGVDPRFEPLQRMYHPGGLNADDTEQRGDDREDLEPLHPYSVHAIRVSLCADFVPKDERVTNGQPAT